MVPSDNIFYTEKQLEDSLLSNEGRILVTMKDLVWALPFPSRYLSCLFTLHLGNDWWGRFFSLSLKLSTSHQSKINVR